MQKKKFLATYGPIFFISYIGSFILLVTLYSRLEFPTIWGDILVKKGGFILYLPWASSLAISLLIVAIVEMYRFTKRL